MHNDEPPEKLEIPDTPESLDMPFTSPAQQEPAAGWRGTAFQMRQFYSSLVQSGFTSQEAFELIKVVIKSAAEQGMRGQE